MLMFGVLLDGFLSAEIFPYFRTRSYLLLIQN
jgi:hypothetical protein